MTGARLFAEMMRDYGVSHIFFVPAFMLKAFAAATTGAPGPVHLRVQSHLGQLTEAEAEFDATVEMRYSKVPPFRPEPDMEQVKAALDALMAAKRPVIVAGGGVVRSGAEQEVGALAEKLSIPVATSLHAKAALVDDHPLNLGVCGAYSR